MSPKEREDALLAIFKTLSQESFYEKLMELGRALPPFPAKEKSDETRVRGCQSIMHCCVTLENGAHVVAIDSEALISKGLGALVTHLYDGASLKEALTFQPSLFREPGLFTSLSMSRLNGLEALLKYVLKKILQLASNPTPS